MKSTLVHQEPEATRPTKITTAKPGKPSSSYGRIESLRDLKQARENPREITVQNLNHLKSSIEEFGDISGIVFNTRSGELVSGHQRVFALTEAYGNLPIVNGKIELPTGETFTIRFVDWSYEDQLAASLAANSPTLQGTFTNEVSSLLSNLSDLLPNVYDSLGFAGLKPATITGPASWSDDYTDEVDSSMDGRGFSLLESSRWDESPEAREGKAISEEVPKDLVLEARFDVRAPEKVADKFTDRLLKLSSEFNGVTVRGID